MTTQTYKVTGLFGKATPFEYVVDNNGLAEVQANPMYTVEHIYPYTPVIRYKVDPTCERCTTDEYVPHYNCMYHGNAVGHSAAHCTANACY